MGFKKQKQITLIMYIFTNPSAGTGCNTGSSLTEFSFSSTCCHTNVEEPSLPYNLPTDRGRLIGFTPFLRVQDLCEMQIVLSRIELVSLCPFPIMVTIKLQMHPNINHVKSEIKSSLS